MDKAEPIEWFSARFKARETEASYQTSVFERHLRSHVWGVSIGIAFITLYIFSEFIDSPNPSFGIATRIVTVVTAGLLLALMLHKRFQKHHDLITMLIFLVMGLATNLNIWRQPTLDNTFYLGLVQGYIMFTLILRLNFTSVTAIIAITQASFIAIVFTKNDLQNAILQSANTLVIATICVAGSYLLQRYQRADFLKNRTIKRQNEQLTELLKDAERGNERKIAALNLLVHFVKTPLHQIAGFSDIVANAAQTASENETAENARYIKTAASDLTKAVNALLAYHRLDENENRADPELVLLSTVIDDFQETLPATIEVNAGAPQNGAICVDPQVLHAALQAFADYAADPRSDVSRVGIQAELANGKVDFSIQDDGRILSAAEFADQIQPLTRLEGYLTRDGGHLPMALRTFARAAELLGGDFTHRALADGNRFRLTLAAANEAAMAA